MHCMVAYGHQLSNLTYPDFAVSPDGKQFVYNTPKRLYMRSVNEFDAKLLTGTEMNPLIHFFPPSVNRLVASPERTIS